MCGPVYFTGSESRAQALTGNDQKQSGQMSENFSRPQAQYLRAGQIRKRYGFSESTFYRLCHHDDPLVRFPKPRLILGSTPLWFEADVVAYEAARTQVSGTEPQPETPKFEFDRDGPTYLRKSEVARRYSLDRHTIERLMLHPDVALRFPSPSLVIGLVQYWSVNDLDRFDAEQEEVSRRREGRRPDEQYRSKPGQPKRGRRRQKK